jgi:hypothetical protein
LILHWYFFWHAAFVQWGWKSFVTDRLLSQIAKTGLFRSFNTAKSIALTALVISLLGTQGRNHEGVRYPRTLMLLGLGTLVYYSSGWVVFLSADKSILAWIYMFWTITGYLLFIVGGARLSRIIRVKWNDEDIFNKENQTFPQEEKMLSNEYSINLPARYRLKNKWRSSWINIINPFRGLLVIGSPGSGKSYFVVEEVIRQHIEKGFAMFVYDFKFDDLTRITQKAFDRYKANYKITPQFYIVNFEDFSRSHRCNPFDPAGMEDITDATEASRTILLSLNRNWISKQGDFFVESSVNFLTAIIWFLTKYEKGQYCTLPHVIELMQLDYDKLFTILRTEPEIETLISPFINTYLSDVMETLESQISTPKIALGRLASPRVYYILSGNDFSLDINNPRAPKIVCMGNNPQKQQVYGAILSLYISRMIKIINKRGGIACSLIFDEFPTVYFNGIDSLIATARSNRVSTTITVQDYSQLKKDYGKELAEVIMNIVGNVISGQVMGDMAKQLSDRFGKTKQDKRSLSINSSDTSVSKSKQLEVVIPPSVISNLSSGEFVGMVTDNPNEKIELKVFHNEIQKKKKDKNISKNRGLEMTSRSVSPQEIQNQYLKIKNDIVQIAESVITLLMNDPLKSHLIVHKKESRRN